MSAYKSVSKSVFRSVHPSTKVPWALLGGGAAQSAFDDIWGWWRADNVSGSSPTMAFTDLSGHGRTMTQQAGTLTAGTSANGQASLTGNSTAYLTSAATMESWPVTVVCYGQRTNNSTQGHFGHTGATGYNSLWCGYESTNRHMIYNTNSTSNTNAATDGVWVSRVGWGSRCAIINGLAQDSNTLASIARSAATATTIGTQYRGLAMDWQECLVWNRVLSVAELDEVYVYLNTRYSASIPLSTSRTPTKVVGLYGESNAAGRGDRGASNVNIPAEYLGAIANASVWYGGPTSNQGMATAWETLDNTVAKAIGNATTGNHMLGDIYTIPPTYVGCESALCKEYLDANGGTIYLHKYALGGSYMAATGSYWHHSAGAGAQNAAARLFGQCCGNWWRSMAAHDAAGRTPDLLGVVFIQGANDATNATHAGNYQANLTEFVDRFREEIGYPNARLLLARLHATCPETYSSTVRAAQEAVITAADNVEMIDMDGYETRGGDAVHYSVNGQHALGQYLATQL